MSVTVPFELVKDGDLLLLVERMLHLGGLDTVRITKVKGHADEAMVHNGQVREVGRLDNDAADEAADFGRRRVGDAVIDARRNLSGVCGRWYPVILSFHRFFIAISRAVVNHDGRDGTVLDPLIWSAGARPKRRCLVHAVRDRAFLLGPPGIWDGGWVNIPASAISDDDVACWLCTPCLLVKWISLLGSLHWPDSGLDLGVGGISYVELLILYELWAGERLSLETAHPRYLRPGRPISVSAVPFGPRRFVPCSIGANHCRLRYIGWERCGHGLDSRPCESSSEVFLDELLGLFRYLRRSGRALLSGTLPLRYSAARFACQNPTWRLPVPGHVVDLVTVDGGAVRDDVVGGAAHEVLGFCGSGPGRKRIRLNRKTPGHLAGFVVQSRPRVWKRLRHVGFSGISIPDHKRRRGDQRVSSPDLCRPTTPALHVFKLASSSVHAQGAVIIHTSFIVSTTVTTTKTKTKTTPTTPTTLLLPLSSPVCKVPDRAQTRGGAEISC